MRNVILWLMAAFLLVSTMVFDANAGPLLERIVAKETLVVGTSGQQPPMSATTKEGNLIGLDIDLAKAMAEALNVEVQFVTLPFADLLPALKDGKVDMVISGMTITPGRNREVAFIGPYYVSGKGILALEKRYAELQEADGLNAPEVSVAVLRGSTSAAFAESLMPDAKRLLATSYDEGIELVLQKKADVMVADLPFCVYAAYRHRDKGLSAGKSPLTFEPLGVAITEDTLLINWVQNFLNTLQGTGKLKKLQRKWLEGGSWIEQLP